MEREVQKVNPLERFVTVSDFRTRKGTLLQGLAFLIRLRFPVDDPSVLLSPCYKMRGQNVPDASHSVLNRVNLVYLELREKPNWETGQMKETEESAPTEGRGPNAAGPSLRLLEFLGPPGPLSHPLPCG